MSLNQEQKIEHQQLLEYLYSLYLTQDKIDRIIEIVEENYI